MVFPLSVVLKTSANDPLANVLVIVSPDPANPTSSGTVLSTATAITDANGSATLNLLPSSAGSYYILRVNRGSQGNIIPPLRFQMPAQATSLSQLLQAAYTETKKVPEGVTVQFPGEPFATITYETFEDIDIPVAAGAYAFGDWVELYRATNTTEDSVTFKVIADLNFDPAWPHDNGDRGEVDLQICHRDADGAIVQILVHHEYIYIRNQAGYNEIGSAEIVGIAELPNDHYIDIQARGARQLTTAGNRLIKLVGADSGVQLVKYNVITPQTVKVTVDENTMEGTGSTAKPIKPKIPYTQPEKDKLARIPETVGALDGLTDVTVTDPTDGQIIAYDGTQDKFINQPPSRVQLTGDQIVSTLENQVDPHKLERSALQGETTVSGGVSLPNESTVPPFTLRVQQPTDADKPRLYLTSTDYDAPVTTRNDATITTDNTGTFSLNPRRGLASDNYDNFVGSFAGRVHNTQGQITLSLYNDPPPPTPIYVRGFGGSNTVVTLTHAGPAPINGRTYSVYSANVSENLAQEIIDSNSAQTLSFFTDAGADNPYIFKPATERRSGDWHLLPVQLSELTDVTISSPLDGQVITYDGRKYVNRSLPTSDIPTDLDDLSDVTISSPTDGQVVAYDESTSSFTNKDASTAENLNELSDVEVSSPTDGQLLTYDDSSSKFVNQSPHSIQITGNQIVTTLEHLSGQDRLPRSALRGETTVSGGTTLPDFNDVPNWTLRVRQDRTADNPSLYLTSATYDVPNTGRNRAVLTPNAAGVFSLNPPRGTASDNYDNAVGEFTVVPRSSQQRILLALYGGLSAPPSTLYVRGIGGDSSQIMFATTGTGIIAGRTYRTYNGTVAQTVGASVANTEQTLTFFTDNSGTTPFNIKPEAEHHSRAWHLQSPVNPDYSVTDTESPAFIKNKPTITTIGRLIAVTATLPTTATAFGSSGTVSRYLPHLTLTGAEVTTNYTVSGHTVLAVHPYPQQQIGWIVRALVGTDERCRLLIPLTPSVQYTDTASILADTRICGHTYMGVSGTLNYFLAYQAQNGNQAAPAGSGTIATNLEIFVAINATSGSVTFDSMMTIEVREAVVGTS